MLLSPSGPYFATERVIPPPGIRESRNTATVPTPRVIHGDDLIYRFLRDLFTDDESFAEVARSLLAATAIWFPLSVYEESPVLLPLVVRDPSCRGRGGGPDQWASPDPAGFLRDDNSLIKNLPRSLPVSAPAQRHLNGRRMAREFVAAHVWRQTTDQGPLASRRPILNSFVPNIVWLPSQIAKLTDLEGSTVQRTLQEMSWSRYRSHAVKPHLAAVVEDAWALLPEPTTFAAHSFDDWNYFIPNDPWMRLRQSRIRSVRDAATSLLAGKDLETKVIATRYTEGLPHVGAEALTDLQVFLERFVNPSKVPAA